THVRINLDMLRTRPRELALVAACIAAKQPFVVDNTNVTREERARYIVPAKAAGFRVVGYYLRSNIGDSIERNRGRVPTRVVPDKAIAAMYHRLQPPRTEEGFDELYHVTMTAEGGFAVQDWAEDN
ncbi:MAG: ATP-binding protein, partial [Planctomycetaceae bacterium]